MALYVYIIIIGSFFTIIYIYKQTLYSTIEFAQKDKHIE